MPSPIPYRQWIEKNKKAGQALEETYLTYIRKELLAKAGFTKLYTRQDALEDLHEAAADMLDDFAESLPERIKQAPKTRDDDADAGSAPAAAAARRKSLSTASGSQEKPEEDETAGQGGALRPLDDYKGEAQFGDRELRKVLLDVGKNPDIGADKIQNADKELKDDAKQWGVARPSRSMKLDAKNLDAFRSAPPASVWLGFVRIGTRVGLPEDKIILIQIAERAASGFALPASRLRDGEPWHLVALNEHFNEHKNAKVKSWNGWDAAELRRDPGKGPGVPLVATGCHFGFFLVKARDGGSCHYFSFLCASINRYANAGFSSRIPDMPVERMSKEQYTALTGLEQSARGGIELDEAYLSERFPGVAFKRGVLGVEKSSKKVPLSFRKNVVETMRKL